MAEKLIEQRGATDAESTRILAGAELEVNETMRMTPVVVGDVGADYVAGSAGQVKYIDTFMLGATTGDKMKRYTFKYANATYPTFCTSISLSIIDYA